MGEQGRTIGERARIAAGNTIERDREAATAALIRRLVEENEQLRRDNDVLAIGIEEALLRIEALEKHCLAAVTMSPYTEPTAIETASLAVADMRARRAS